MMSETEDKILRELVGLDDALSSIATAEPKPDLLAIFQRLDGLTAELPKSADPELLHFMHKKSYQKARLLLEGRNGENAVGACRH